MFRLFESVLLVERREPFSSVLFCVINEYDVLCTSMYDVHILMYSVLYRSIFSSHMCLDCVSTSGESTLSFRLTLRVDRQMWAGFSIFRYFYFYFFLWVWGILFEYEVCLVLAIFMLPSVSNVFRLSTNRIFFKKWTTSRL